MGLRRLTMTKTCAELAILRRKGSTSLTLSIAFQEVRIEPGRGEVPVRACFSRMLMLYSGLPSVPPGCRLIYSLTLQPTSA